MQFYFLTARKALGCLFALVNCSFFTHNIVAELQHFFLVCQSEPHKLLQCGRSSLAQRWGSDLRPQYHVKIQMTLKILIKRSQQLPEMFEIVLGPSWWAAGNEQPSPPLHRAAAARLLRCFDKYNSLYSTNLLAIIFLEYNEGGDGCSFPAARQSCPSTISNISGNCWDLFINVLRVFWTLTLHWCLRSAPHLWDRLDRPHCTYMGAIGRTIAPWYHKVIFTVRFGKDVASQ